MDIINKINEHSVYTIVPRLSIIDIENVLQLASDYYHNKGISLISDEVYDILYDHLKSINPNSIIFFQTGATPKEKSRLPYAVASLDKISTKEELIRWVNKYPDPYVVSDKLDGVSCILLSKNNQLFLYTRGDGRYGKKYFSSVQIS
jgi:NAD-dependent DNA ligase